MFKKAKSSIEEIEARRGTVDDNISAKENELEIEGAHKAESEENLKVLNERIDENNNSMSGYQLKVKNKTDKADALKDKLEKNKQSTCRKAV